MANLKLKDVTKLETWNEKELRKLKMTTRNRISLLEKNSSPKELADNHPLFGKNLEDCNHLLDQILKTEKKAKKTT